MILASYPVIEEQDALYPAGFSCGAWADLNIVVKSKVDGSDIPFTRSEDGWTITVDDGPVEGVTVESIQLIYTNLSENQI